MLYAAADMHPRAERDIVHQHPIAGTQHDCRVHKAFGAVDRRAFAQLAQSLRQIFGGDAQRAHRQPSAGGERPLVGRRALRRRRRRQRRRCGRQSGLAGRAQFAAAFKAQRELVPALAGGDRDDVAIIDRFQEAAFGGAALEPQAAPTLDRQMRHIAVDVDAGDKPACEAEAARDDIVVDLVVGQARGVESLNRVAEFAHRLLPARYARRQSLHAPACFAILSLAGTARGPWTANFPNTSFSPSAMRGATHAVPTISSAAIRMTGRCRWIISYGSRAPPSARSSSTAALPPRSPPRGSANSCAARSSRWRWSTSPATTSRTSC